MRKLGILLLVLVAVSCTKKELDREEAKRLIAESKTFPRLMNSTGASPQKMAEVPNSRDYLMSKPWTEGFALVATCKEDVAEITGVVNDPGGTTASAEFTTKQDTTPFATPGSCVQGKKLTARFERFDDGWRMTSLDPE
jgi:hypothetical protein